MGTRRGLSIRLAGAGAVLSHMLSHMQILFMMDPDTVHDGP